MKKWLRFFGFSFFSHKTAKEGVKRGYTNVFLGFVLVLAFLWAGLIGGDMLPFGIHYRGSPDFTATVHTVFANQNIEKRIYAEIKDGGLKLKRYGGEYTDSLLVNTFDNEDDKRDYSVSGYDVVVDSRPADTLAEVEAYCVSNDGKNTEITYTEYLTLSEVARLNFDFRLRYTGNELVLDDETVATYRAYVDGLSEDQRLKTKKLADDLDAGVLTETAYKRAIYELYFENYYPRITEYESTSNVPMLRNYYYHEYITQGAKNYLFIFDDYLTASFETKNGISVSFYGFFSSLDDGAVVCDGIEGEEANAAADAFIKSAFKANSFLSMYAYALNVISLAPFIALMLMVATLLTYSVLRLRGVESISSLGAMLKIIGSFAWFSGMISAVLSVMMAFFVKRSLTSALPLVFFFAALVIRSLIFAVNENRLYLKQSEQQGAEQTEV